MLRDSLEDFNSPMSRKITFNPLKDVRRPKKPKGRATRKKAKEVKTEATEEEVRKCLIKVLYVWFSYCPDPLYAHVHCE